MKDYLYNATLVRVIDGDTILCDIDLGFYMTCRIPVRLAHINAPEHNQKGGKEATDYLTFLLVDPQTKEPTPMLLRTYKPHDKYGRYLAEIFVDGLDKPTINSMMIISGHAVAYEGGAR